MKIIVYTTTIFLLASISSTAFATEKAQKNKKKTRCFYIKKAADKRLELGDIDNWLRLRTEHGKCLLSLRRKK